jgi:hypothetical protein
MITGSQDTFACIHSKNISSRCIQLISWRNGSASDSRPESCEFNSHRGHCENPSIEVVFGEYFGFALKLMVVQRMPVSSWVNASIILTRVMCLALAVGDVLHTFLDLTLLYNPDARKMCNPG